MRQQKIKVEEDIAFKGVDMVEPIMKISLNTSSKCHGTNSLTYLFMHIGHLGGILQCWNSLLPPVTLLVFYPLYDTTRFNKARRPLVIVPKYPLRQSYWRGLLSKGGDTFFLRHRYVQLGDWWWCRHNFSNKVMVYGLLMLGVFLEILLRYLATKPKLKRLLRTTMNS